MSDKGQTMLLDFSLAVFIFLLAFGALTVFWIEELNEKLQQQHLEEMNLKASLAAEMLVKSPGDPVNWEELDEALANAIGLAFLDRSVNEQKLNAFKDMDYDKARQLLNISEYDFFFQFEGADDVNAGLLLAANIDSVTVSRIVEYKGSEAIAKITIYRA